ncbi:MAG: M48 family metallopeptidase [Chthonomonadales bacterium]|nr:M48 family metallopeptidase [Chthonomonadales bacterium]
MSQFPDGPLPRNIRDDVWLACRVSHLWDLYYADVIPGYPIDAHFGPRARRRFGSIRARGRTCLILVNGLFAHPDVPDYVVDATLVHELAHYVHGYGSGTRRLHANPHQGGVVDREMELRGCLFLEDRAAAWRRRHWSAHYAIHASDVVARRARRQADRDAAWAAILAQAGWRPIEEVRALLATTAPAFGLTEPPFEVEWLLPSSRKSGLSYRFAGEGVVRMHALLAHPAVPREVVLYELAYWLAAARAGPRWRDIEGAIAAAGLSRPARAAIGWRRSVWPAFRREQFPVTARRARAPMAPAA